MNEAMRLAFAFRSRLRGFGDWAIVLQLPRMFNNRRRYKMRNKVIKIVLLFVCCLCVVAFSILLYLYYQTNHVYQCDEYLTNAYIVNCNDTQFLFLEFDTSSVEKTFGTSAIFLSSNYVSKDISTSEIHINILGKYATTKKNTKLYSAHYVVLSTDDFLTNRTSIISGYSRKKC